MPIKSKNQWKWLQINNKEMFNKWQKEHLVKYEDLPENLENTTTRISKLLEYKYDVIVTWIDRDYKGFKKVFKNNPNGSSDNAMIRARKFADKLNKENEESSEGLYRSVAVDYFKEID